MTSLFVVLLKYLQPLPVVDLHLAAHRVFLDQFYANKMILCSGRQEPREGGVILCRAASKDEVWAMIHQDPFYQQKIAEYSVVEFIPTKGMGFLKD